MDAVWGGCVAPWGLQQHAAQPPSQPQRGKQPQRRRRRTRAAASTPPAAVRPPCVRPPCHRCSACAPEPTAPPRPACFASSADLTCVSVPEEAVPSATRVSGETTLRHHQRLMCRCRKAIPRFGRLLALTRKLPSGHGKKVQGCSWLWAHQVNLGKPCSSLAVCIVQQRVAQVAALLLHKWRSGGAHAVCLVGSVLHS